MDRVSYELSFFFNFQLNFLDITLEYNHEDHENVHVPLGVYDKACIKDAKEGVEVRQVCYCN